jgi:hypothetical protein
MRISIARRELRAPFPPHHFSYPPSNCDHHSEHFLTASRVISLYKGRVSQAQAQFDEAQKAMQQGDWAKFGEPMEGLKRLLAGPAQ